MKPLPLILLFAAVLLVAGSGVQASQATQGVPFRHPASALPYGASPSAQPTQSSVNYDEQIGMTFSQTFTSVSYNVTAVQQTDTNGYGPAYLLNGLTDRDYWYQIGITYDWPAAVGYNPGWAVVYEVWDSAQNSIFPANAGGGLANFTGTVNGGDKVLLTLYFSGGQVQMAVKDWNTGATGSEPYPAFGSKFVGLTSPSDSNGYFTGPMTEWYHVKAYYATDSAVVYDNQGTALASADAWADEFNANTNVPLFGSDQILTFTNPNQLLSFSTNGAEIHADAYTFITGALTQTTLTLGFSVLGGGSGYSSPTLTYVSNGTTRTATLTGPLVSYFADIGTSWSVSASLPGSSSTERWATGQTGGNANSPMTESVTYYHQYLVLFVYGVSGGGTGYSAPSVTTTALGGSASVKGNASAWADAGAAFTYPNLLSGSSESERWIAQSGVSGTVSEPGPISVQYFLQYGLTLSYSVVGGGAPGAPSLTGTLSGRPFTSTVTNSTYFVDPGSAWNVTALLPGSNSQERWVTTQPISGIASAPTSLVLPYQHQYTVAMAAAPTAGGTTSQVSGWADAGSTFQLSQAPSQGWKFEGWTGSGSGSYTGPSDSATVTVDAPITETAAYYPGLNIQAGANGAVTYSYGTTSGTVQAGSSQIIFASPGTTITLVATPSSFLYSFSGWELGAAGTSPSATVTLSSPATVLGNFSINTLVVGGISAGAVLAGALGLVLVIRSRRRPPAQN